MSGAVEEAGKAAGTFMTVMKDQPLALALCAMNIMLMGLFFYIAKTASEANANRFTAMMNQQSEVQQLLYNCVPAEGKYKVQSEESHPVELPPR
jgi:hypothetical protein